MQIVINLPDTNITEDIIRAAKWEDGSLFDWVLRGAMKDAIILPKGHGRIGDLDRLYNVFEKNVVSADAFKELFDHAPTIIEADRSEEDG